MSTKRKQVTLAVMGSVGIHLIVLFAWAFSVQWFPAAQAASSQPPDEIKLQVVEEKPDLPATPAEEPMPKLPIKPLVINDPSDAPDADKPKDPAFQSDKNSEAASELPATGDKPLPTQKGKPVPSFAFDPQPVAAEADSQKLAANMPPAVLETAPPLPRPAVSTPPPAQSPPPAPTATPAAVPADPRDLAMVTPQSIPANPVDADPNPYDPSIRPPANMTEPPRPTPVPRRGSSYRPLQERTETAGGIGKTGTDSVASEATPTGRYTAFIIRSINRRWHQYFDARADLVTLGTVRVHFAVDRSGKIRASRVVSNTANEALASIALQAVAEAQIPPMSEEVVAVTNGGQLPIEIFFNAEAPRF